MHLLPFLYPTLLAASTLISSTTALRSDKIKLSQIQSLTLRKDQKTSHRRVSAIPQLKCVSGSGCKHYEVDVMRCKNAGYDYNEEDVQWTCTASLPPEFKLGSTDVICEGYDSPDDPYILKGSCGVEYRLLLTDKGHEKFGKGKWWEGDDSTEGSGSAGEKFTSVIFWIIFIGVALWIFGSAISGFLNRPRGAGAAGGGRPGWGGGGGGGGGWWPGGDNDDPPPPYGSWNSSPKPQPNDGSARQQGWRPGVLSGALGGAAAGYMAGRAFGGRGDSDRRQNQGFFGGGGRQQGEGSSWWNNGEGSSRSSRSSSGSAGYSSVRYESTGFGSTSRR